MGDLKMDLCKTGIPGFDEMIGGGIPRGWNVMVCGDPGSGKSSFSAEFLHRGMEKFKEKGILLLLDEPYSQYSFSIKQIGVDLTPHVKSGDITVINASPISGFLHGDTDLPVIDVDLPAGLEGLSLDTLKQAITVVTENNDIKRLTIDSISALKLGMDEKQFRHELIRFFDYISSLGITSLIVAEIPSSAIEERFSVEHFLSQGVVFLRLIRVKDEKIRAVEIHKLRAVKHDLTLRPLTMDDTGVTIYPEERVFVSGLND